MTEYTEEDIIELVLLLSYLTSWDENARGKFGPDSVLYSWKGYPFEALDRLKERGLVDFKNRNKSLHITEEGIEKARELAEKWKSS